MKLLLHICCAPCLEYPYEVLSNDNHEFTGYFFNPNIQPDWEYQRRKDTLLILSNQKSIPVYFSEVSDDLKYMGIDCFEDVWKTLPIENRCENCYRTRLERTAIFALNNGFDTFSSTLLGSIYQNYDLICSIGHEMADKYGIIFYERDFRDGFRQGQHMAKKEGLYRQKYCGCIVSLDNSVFKEKIINSFLFDNKK